MIYENDMDAPRTESYIRIDALIEELQKVKEKNPNAAVVFVDHKDNEHHFNKVDFISDYPYYSAVQIKFKD